MKTVLLELAPLVRDPALYPRPAGGPWYQHIVRYAEAMRNGEQKNFPPILAGRLAGESGKIYNVDGWTRQTAAEKVGLKKFHATIKYYKSKAEMFLDSVYYNMRNGESLDVHAIIADYHKAKAMGVSARVFAETVGWRPSLLMRYVSERSASANGESWALKAPIAQLLCGKRLSEGEIQVNGLLSFQGQMQPIAQLSAMLEENLVDLQNPKIAEALKHLAVLIRKILNEKRR